MSPEEIQAIRNKYKYDPTSLSTGSGNAATDTNSRLAAFRSETPATAPSNVSGKSPVLEDVKTGLGGALHGLTGVTLTGIDYLGRKAVEALPNDFSVSVEGKQVTKQQMLENLKSPNLHEQFKKVAGGDKNPIAYNVGEMAGEVAAAAIPATKAGQIVGKGVKAVSEAAKLDRTGTIASKVAKGATDGYVFDLVSKLSEGKTEDLLNPGVGTAIGAALPAVGVAGRVISKAGEKVIGLAIPTSAKEAQILQSYKAKNTFAERVGDLIAGESKSPTTATNVVAKTKAGQTLPGLFGTKTAIGVQAKRAGDSLWNNLIKPKLEASNKAVDLDGFFSKVQKDIIESTPELNRQNSLLEALESVKEDYVGLKSVDMPKLQALKEGWASFVPEKAYKGKPIAGAFNEVRNLLSDEARTTIYNTLGKEVKQAYFDYGTLKGLQEYGQKAMTGEKLKGGAGSFIQELISEAVTPVATIAGQVIYRTGKGIEMIGNAGAKTVGDVLEKPKKVNKPK